MWHLLKVVYGKHQCYIITRDLKIYGRAYKTLGFNYEIVAKAPEAISIQHIWMEMAKTDAVPYTSLRIPIFIDGEMYDNIFTAMIYMKFMGRGLLGWRVRRLGAWLGEVGLRMRERRSVRKARRRRLFRGWFTRSVDN